MQLNFAYLVLAKAITDFFKYVWCYDRQKWWLGEWALVFYTVPQILFPAPIILTLSALSEVSVVLINGEGLSEEKLA